MTKDTKIKTVIGATILTLGSGFALLAIKTDKYDVTLKILMALGASAILASTIVRASDDEKSY